MGHVEPCGHADFSGVLGSCGVMDQGFNIRPKRTPIPSQEEINECTPTPLHIPHSDPKPLPTSSHTLYVPILHHPPVSHLQLTSCLLLNSILLLQPVFPHPLMSLYPPNTPPESPIAPQGPSQTQHISPTDFAQGLLLLHTFACTWMECAHRSVQGCVCTCV